jgi:uncharacterized protein (TIGR02147 family)
MEFNDSIADVLRQELQKRKRVNGHYSLRAFARNLGLSSSFLSKVIAGKRSVSQETFYKITSRLNLSQNHTEALFNQSSIKVTTPDFEIIKADHFRLISDWHHYAILECATLTDFEPSARWIANRLSISEERAKTGLERLTRLGLLKIDKNGQVISVAQEHYTSGILQTVPSTAHTEHERQVLEGALVALDKFSTERRHQSSMTIAIPESRLKEARDRIRKFRRELTAQLQRRGKRDSVYQLSISFYPLTTKSNDKITKNIP